MIDWARPHKPFLITIASVLVAPFVLIALMIAFDSVSTPVARWRGHLAAYRDVRHGHYVELGYGLPPAWLRNYAPLLHQRYPDANYVAVAGCIVSSQLQAYVDTYDQYSANAALHRYGHDIFRETANDAERAWARNHPRQSDRETTQMSQKPPTIAIQRSDEETELRRNKLPEFLRSNEPAWRSEDHPELAAGTKAWVRNLRRESDRRFLP
jgi:hypothetical protein